jgi:hypothetical protein
MVEQVGQHKLRCGSIMDGGSNEIIRMCGQGGVDYVYSDPPWGTGNLRYWQTMNRKSTGQDIPAPDEDSFMSMLFHIIKEVSNQRTVVFIEYSCKGWPDLQHYASAVQLRLYCEAETAYQSGSKVRPMMVGIFAYEPPPSLSANHADRVRGTHGMNTVHALTAGFPMSGRSLFDPCCGLGNSAKLALNRGMTFYGNELNAARLAKTKAVLARGV